MPPKNERFKRALMVLAALGMVGLLLAFNAVFGNSPGLEAPAPSVVKPKSGAFATDLTTKDAYKRFVDREDYAGGVSAFESELAAHPSDARLYVGLAQLHCAFAQYPEAQIALECALTLHPDHASAHNCLGIVLSQQGQRQQAFKHLDFAVRIDPNYADAYFNRAVLLAMGTPPDKPAARKAYQQAISLGCEPDPALDELIR